MRKERKAETSVDGLGFFRLRVFAVDDPVLNRSYGPHDGQAEGTVPSVNSRSPVESGLTAWTFPPLENAISLPSGDQEGATASPSVVTACDVPPAALTT